jgi:simple sugar transport system permease protein
VRALIAVLVSLFLTLILLRATGAPPYESLAVIFDGAFGNPGRIADTLMAWAPLVLAAAGLVVTFAAGLWNIGVEGQVTAGAIAASWVARELPGPAYVLIPAMLLAGIAGGALWGLLAGWLKVKGNVNEIFGGLGLGFVALSFATFLVIGPWKREGVASTSGTDPFRPEAWLPTVGDTRLAPVAVLLAIAGIAAVAYSIRGTRFGLRLRAVGSNPASARLLGVPPQATLLRAFMVGGGMAGLAGAVIASGIQHKLVPAIAGGRGYLAILVVLLASFRAAWVAPVAVFFAAISTGAAQLQLQLDLDSSLGGVIQGILVLVFLLTGGLLTRWQSRKAAASG